MLFRTTTVVRKGTPTPAANGKSILNDSDLFLKDFFKHKIASYSCSCPFPVRIKSDQKADEVDARARSLCKPFECSEATRQSLIRLTTKYSRCLARCSHFKLITCAPLFLLWTRHRSRVAFLVCLTDLWVACAAHRWLSSAALHTALRSTRRSPSVYRSSYVKVCKLSIASKVVHSTMKRAASPRGRPLSPPAVKRKIESTATSMTSDTTNRALLTGYCR